MAGFSKSTAFGNAITGSATKAQLTFTTCEFMTCEKTVENDVVLYDIYGISEKDAKESQLWNVMINPNSIYESYGISYETEGGIDGDPKVKKSRKPGSRTISMDLIFDLVDTYELAYNKLSTTGVINFGMSLFTGSGGKDYDETVNAYRNTLDGKLPRQFAGYNWGSKVSEIDLNNPNLSCLTRLKLAVADKNHIHLVKFEWGRFNIEGLVNDLNVRYTYFSPEGMALRAETSLRIVEVPVGQAKDHKKHVEKPKLEDKSSPPDTTFVEEENTESWD